MKMYSGLRVQHLIYDHAIVYGNETYRFYLQYKAERILDVGPMPYSWPYTYMLHCYCVLRNQYVAC